MSLQDDLLEQARHLVTRERRRPRQASLRRSISAAYYALFHLLTDEASRLILPDITSANSRARVGRTFGHAEMKKVSLAFSSKLKASEEVYRLVRASPPIPPDLTTVSRAFVDLQEARHEADYNTARRYTRQEVTTLVESASEAFAAWRRIRTTPVAQTYLVALVVWKKWDRL